MKDKSSKCIFSPQLAQYLLQCGFKIIDLKPKRDFPKETVFVFEYVKGFDEQVGVWLEERD